MRNRVDRRFRRRLEARPSVEPYEDRLLLSGGFSQYPIADSFSAQRLGITAGGDGNIWFADATGKIGRVTPDGTVSLFSVDGLVPPGYMPLINGITTAPDGSVWFAGGNGIGKIATDGTVTTIVVPGNTGPSVITADQAGNLWFLPDGDHITRYNTAAGTFTTFDLPENPTHISPNTGGIVLGPDGNIWFTRLENLAGHSNLIDRITPDGTVTEFPIDQGMVNLRGLTVGPDGNLWFAEQGEVGKIGRMTLDGAVVEYAVPGQPAGIASGPDGNLWFTMYTTGQIGRISPTGELEVYSAPAGDPPLANPEAITVGPDGALWFTEAGVDRIGRLDPTTATPDGAPAPPPAPVAVAVHPPAQPESDGVVTARRAVSNPRLEVFAAAFRARHSALTALMTRLSQQAGSHPGPAAAQKLRAARLRLAGADAAANGQRAQLMRNLRLGPRALARALQGVLAREIRSIQGR